LTEGSTFPSSLTNTLIDIIKADIASKASPSALSEPLVDSEAGSELARSLGYHVAAAHADFAALPVENIAAIFAFLALQGPPCAEALATLADALRTKALGPKIKDLLKILDPGHLRRPAVELLFALCSAMVSHVPQECSAEEAVSYCNIIAKIGHHARPELRAELHSRFVSKIKGNHAASLAVVRVPAIVESIKSGDEAYRSLAQSVIDRLPTEPLTFSWKQPTASFPSNPAVQDFLRGPAATFQVKGFGGIKEARSFAALFGRYGGYKEATAQETGSGKQWEVNIL
jgi:hypothetical protein